MDILRCTRAMPAALAACGVGLLILIASPAEAMHPGSHSGGHASNSSAGRHSGSWSGNHGLYYGRSYGYGGYGWRGGYPRWGGYGWGYGFGIGFVDPFWWDPWYAPVYAGGYNYGYVPLPYPDDTDQAPPLVAPPAAQQPFYWYYCAESKSYYPYVGQCPSAWQRVTPPSAPPPSGSVQPGAPTRQ